MDFDAHPKIVPPAGGMTDDRARLALVTFVFALAGLLVGYMFLGRGFAHIGFGPVYIGELVLAAGMVALALVRPRLRVHWLHVVLLVFMAWSLARTLPYLLVYGTDALRDAVLWGYATFAIAVSLLATRELLAWITNGYRWVAVLFVLWLPPAWWISGNYGDQLPRAPGSDVSLLFFKNQDMAVHLSGVAAFLVIGFVSTSQGRWFVRELAVAVPLAFMVYITGSISRGALAATAAGALALAVVRTRSKHWFPVIAGGLIVVVLVSVSPLIVVAPTESLYPVPTVSATATADGSPTATRTPRPTAPPTPAPTPIEAGRDVSPGQLFENIFSVFGESSDEGLEGTKQFRLAWWSKIIDYTIGGPYFWTGKGYGINLANDDGFQPTADASLRAPHNSHFTVLARSGVPGFVLWLVLQIGFGFTLLFAAIRARRRGLVLVSAVSAWILVYWFSMMVNTSFDPYLEGPQGGIWFWALFGLGLACIQMAAAANEPDAAS